MTSLCLSESRILARWEATESAYWVMWTWETEEDKRETDVRLSGTIWLKKRSSKASCSHILFMLVWKCSRNEVFPLRLFHLSPFEAWRISTHPVFRSKLIKLSLTSCKSSVFNHIQREDVTLNNQMTQKVNVVIFISRNLSISKSFILFLTRNMFFFPFGRASLP